jgi:hypothetical protein
MKSTPPPQDAPPVAGLKPVPDNGIAEADPVTVVVFVPANDTGSFRILVPELPSKMLALPSTMRT